MGFIAEPAGIEADERQAEYRRRFPGEADLPILERRALMFPQLFGAISAPAMLPGLMAAAEAFVPDVVIHDAAEFASAVVAERIGVPHLTHSFGALVPLDLVRSAGEEVSRLWESAGLSARPFGGSYDHLYLDIYPPALQSTSADHVPRVQRLRPVAVDAAPGQQLPAHLRQLSRPVVYVTFGTVFNAAAVFGPVIEAACELEATVVVTVGPDGDPEALGRAAERCCRAVRAAVVVVRPVRRCGVARRIGNVPVRLGAGRSAVVPATGRRPVRQRVCM